MPTRTSQRSANAQRQRATPTEVLENSPETLILIMPAIVAAHPRRTRASAYAGTSWQRQLADVELSDAVIHNGLTQSKKEREHTQRLHHGYSLPGPSCGTALTPVAVQVASSVIRDQTLSSRLAASGRAQPLEWQPARPGRRTSCPQRSSPEGKQGSHH